MSANKDIVIKVLISFGHFLLHGIILYMQQITCDMCRKTEMESGCMEDELDADSFLHPMGTSIIHNSE